MLTCNAFSQTSQVKIIDKAMANNIMEKHKDISERIKTQPGFRIQIYFDSGANSKIKSNIIKIKYDSLISVKRYDEDFIAKFPNTKSYLMYQEPNYKIRVGDFRTSFEAQGLLNYIIDYFPNAFIIKDEINFPVLHYSTQQIEEDTIK